MRMMNWAALSIAAGMSSCSLMATTTPVAPAVVSPPAAAVADRAAPTPAPAADVASRTAA